MQIQEAYDLVKDELQEVEAEYGKHLDSDVYLIRRVANYILTSGGKRFRPSLLLLSAKLCGYDGGLHIPLSAVIEFIHTATLLHDDVVDDADLRRGTASANAVWGNQASILVGDYLFSKAFYLMVESRNMEVLRVLSRATIKLAEGEILQLLKNSDIDTNEQEYLTVATNKTAALISAACQVSGILADVAHEKECALAGYGMNLGIAFQLMDDCLDYTSKNEDLGKAVGNDLKEGKVTMPLIYTLQRSSAEERERIVEAIEAGEINDNGHLESVIGLIRRHGAIEQTIDTARRHIETAKDHLAQFEPTVEKAALMAIADYVIERSF